MKLFYLWRGYWQWLSLSFDFLLSDRTSCDICNTVWKDDDRWGKNINDFL